MNGNTAIVIFNIAKRNFTADLEIPLNISANELVAQTNAGKNQQIISLEPDVWYLSGGGLESMKLMIEDVNQAFK